MQPLIAVAVSGGPDSMALMLLADRWARMQGGEAWGLTVDHGLRRESADEVRTVASWLGARSIPHAILCWKGPKPTSGIQEAAREARYRLLTAWCRDRGVLHLLAAHHLEDQVETHLIRRRAGSGIDGLAGMSALRELEGCRLVRPLLSVSRRRLTALLAIERQEFLRDPSNLNPIFERARLRLGHYEQSHLPPTREREEARGRSAEQSAVPSPGSPVTPTILEPDTTGSRPPSLTLSSPGVTRGSRRREEWGGRSEPWAVDTRDRATLSRAAGEGLSDRDIVLLTAEIRACACERIIRERALDALIARAVALHPAGFGVVDPALLAAADPETAERLLSRIIACLGGSRYPSRSVRLARLRAALVQQPQRARTLGGCRFVPWRGRLLVLRELALAEPPIALEPGADRRWDRRYAVLLPAGAAGAFTLGYLGQYAGTAPEGGFGRRLPPLVHSVLPAFWDGEGIAAVPHLACVRPGLPVLPVLSFRPVTPLAPPGFTVV